MAKLKKKTAIELANICLWTYDFDDQTFESRTLFGGESPLKSIEVHDNKTTPTSFAAILEYQEVVVIAFQGTITEFKRDGHFSLPTLMDWIKNFDVKQVETNESQLPGKVHSGFLSELNLIYSKVESSIPRNPDKPIVLTGHSQGGAIAVLAAKRLEQSGHEVKEVYTFGAPRPANQEFVASLNTPVFRVEYGSDLVPHVPPTANKQSLFMRAIGWVGQLKDAPAPLQALATMVEKLQDSNYQSIGELTYANADGGYQTDLDEKQEGSLLSKRRLGLAAAGSKLASDHGLENYIKMFS